MKKSLVIVVIVALCLIATKVSTSVAAPSQGVISIAFDDGNQNQYDNAFPLLKSRGMPGTFYVVTDNLRDFSNDNSYMSMAELQDLQGNGSEIGSHSKTHSGFLGLSDSQIREECYISKQVLQSYHLTVNNLAYPYGESNDHVDSIVSQYYRSGRTAYTVPYIMQTIQFRLTAAGGETGNSTVLSYLQNIVDQVYLTNGWTVIFFHTIVPGAQNTPYTISTKDFEDFLDYVISKHVQTLTVNQALNLPTSRLTMATNYGTVSPVSGQYITGARVTISANPPATGLGERFTWLGWTGSGTGSYDGLNNPASVWMVGSITQTASWKHEYYLNVSSPNGNPSGQGWYNAGSTAYATLATGMVSGGTGIRYVFTGWSRDASGTGLKSNAIAMNGPKTAIANWKTQYYITVASTHGSQTPSAWVDAGSDFTASVTSPTEIVPDNSEWVCTGFSIDGGAYQNGTTYTFTNVQAVLSIDFAWKQQFWIQVNSSRGSPTTSQWIDKGGNLTISVTSPADDDGAGTRYRCTGYRIDDGSLQAGSSFTFTDVQAAHKIEFEWITQYRLVVSSAYGSPNPTGTDWYDAGAQISISVTSPADDDGAGTRYRCTGWDGAGSVPTGKTSTSVGFTINSPSALTLKWITQYYLTVSTNLGSVSPSGDWYDAGTKIDLLATSPNSNPNERYVLDSWIGTGIECYSGKDNPALITINNPLTETASWKLQFQVTFQQIGLQDGFTAHVIVNSVQHTLPYSDWFDPGVSVEFAYEDQLPRSIGTRYVLTSTSETAPLVVGASIDVKGYYGMQYTIETSLIFIPIVLGCLAIVIRRARTKNHN